MEIEQRQNSMGAPDVLVEIAVSIPPKKVRTVKCAIGNRRKAVFRTAFAQELGLTDGEK